jgi:hypothetical protein
VSQPAAPRLSTLLLVAGACLSPAAAGEVTLDAGRYRFSENFRWSGNHAATIGSAPNQATTVWWAEDDWDVHCDGAFISVTPLTDDGIATTNRFHVDIHKAASSDPNDGRLSNTQYAVGGDGSAGVGIMHLDYQDICVARLRNPLLIEATQPGVVTFYAPLFNTTGHWFELAIMPADDLAGAEYSSVPAVESALPFPGGGAEQPGPGHVTLADSINLIAFGTADYPCLGFPGWRTRFGVSKTIDGVRTHYIDEGASQSDYLVTDPSEAATLVHWKVEYHDDAVSLHADLDDDGSFTLLETWPVSVPWNRVHLSLIGAAYQSTHHPDDQCNLGPIRELQWRDIGAWPVQYARTEVWPKNDGATQLPKQLGFMHYDRRDIQRFGAPVNGVPQPNAGEYGYHASFLYCNDGGFPCLSAARASPPPLALTLGAAQLDGLQAASLLTDLKDANSSAHPSVRATLNGQDLGRWPEHDAVLPDGDNWSDWVRRALPVPPSALREGANTLQLTLESGVYMDRIELELMFGPSGLAADRIFRDGFQDVVVAKRRDAATRYRHPHSGRLGLGFAPFLLPGGRAPLHQCSD